MAIVTINDTNLNDIANAIRNKNGKTTKYKPSEMAAAIAAITGGGGGGGTDIDFGTWNLEGDATSAFSKYTSSSSTVKIPDRAWNIFTKAITTPGYVVTKDITKLSKLCYEMTDVDELPFEINIAANQSKLQGASAFRVTSLRKLPKINWNNATVDGAIFFDYLCSGSYYLEDVSALSSIPSVYSTNTSWSGYIFNNCHALRSIPREVMAHIQKMASLKYTYVNTFYCCYALDELVDFPTINLSESSNMFSNTFTRCGRLKRFTFSMNEDGTPRNMNHWKNQTFDFSSKAIGFLTTGDASTMLNYSSTITEDKRVTDDASYAALKNDPDWYTTDSAYSRYNHDSAVETINSLPITSGTGCTIKFSGSAGSKTDGGAINTLTEEEIAVATARGWTVTLA